MMDEAYRSARIYVRDNFAGLQRESEEGYAFAHATASLLSRSATRHWNNLPSRALTKA